MKTKKQLKLLTSIWFLLGLTLLLLNDLVLKELYGNWFTGKLSDFAGLFIFPLFWTVLFPKYKNNIFLITALGFIYWKSPFSQDFIDVWNRFMLFDIDRVVDYSDLLALLILPIAYTLESAKNKLMRVRIHPMLPLLIAAFSFMATSYHTEVPINKSYEFDFPKDTLEDRFTKIDNLNYGNGVSFTQSNPDTLAITIPYDLCFNRFVATVVVEELSKQKTKMTLIHIFHSCPKSKKDKVQAIQGFEERIIEKINQQ